MLSCSELSKQDDLNKPNPKEDSKTQETNKSASISDKFTKQNPIKKGLILPKNEGTWNPCCLHIPKNGLRLYKSPQENSFAKLKLKNKKQSAEYYEAEIEYLNGETLRFSMDNFEMIDYEIFALKFIDAKDSFLQLENELWLSVREIQESKLTPKSWFDFAIEDEYVLGWYGNEPGIALQQNPSIEAESIKLLKGDLLEINLSKEIEGDWVKVVVDEYTIHPCIDTSTEPIKHYTGWIKLISEKGTLNVWTYRKGC